MARARNTTATGSTVDQPLRRDVRALGSMLGELLREQGSQALYDRVESARRLAQARRARQPSAESELARGLSGLEPAMALEVARAFSAWFGLVNIAERVHRLRRSASRRARGAALPGSLRAVLAELVRRGVKLDELRETLSSLTVEPVLTAHPTEPMRRTLLVKEQRMARALLARGKRLDEKAALRIVREELTLAWQTDEHREGRPTVADELEHALYFLGESLWRAVPRVVRELERSLRASFGAEARPLARSVQLHFGSWIGGDMDGNPSVGPDTIRACLARQSERVLERYSLELRELFRRLSQSQSRVAFPESFVQRLEALRALLPGATAEIPERYAGMLHREFLWLVTRRLDATRAAEPGAYRGADELLADLDTLARSVASLGGRSAGASRVELLIERVRCFGLHMATLDVRCDALENRRAVGVLLGDANFEALDTNARTKRLLDELTRDESRPAVGEEDAHRALEVVRAIAECRELHGEQAIGLFVISMAQGADDALAVLYIARAAGLVRDGAVPLDVAPLFETVDDLERAPATLKALLQTELYRAHLNARGGRQWVMLGYSDSNKTSGLISSRVALQRAQTELLAVAAEHGVALSFFHGRGGSISRGGSKPRDAILSSPRGALDGRLRLTEQGEIVRAKYGLVGIAERTLELLLAATLERTLLDRLPEIAIEAPGDPKRDALALTLESELARASRATYRSLVEDDPDFLEYFRSATPIDAIERLALGSRPPRRREMRGVQDLRAIPWVFAWTQSRHLLPGWFGAGAALQNSLETHGLESVRASVQRSTFLRVLLADLEMVLAKSDLGIAKRYAELAGERGERVFGVLQRDHEAACDAVLRIGRAKRLLDRDPRLQRSIELRNPYVDPLSFLQVDLLARWRASGRDDPLLERALFATVRGIAHGMQNTG
jgi:phosphoenolpyruvate carboxylase